jgi:hypothetical protein
VKIAGDLDSLALRILRQLPGVEASAESLPGADQGVDAVVRLADRELPVAVNVRSRVNAAGARRLVDLARQQPDVPLLVVADQTTADARALLRQHGIGLVDANGHAHVELPGVLIHTEGSGDRADRLSRRPVRLSGKAGVAAQALLLNPDRAWKVTELADVARVSPGLAHRVLDRLADEGILDVEGAGPGRVRHVASPGALLDLWAEEQQDRIVQTRAYVLAQTPVQVADRLCAGLEQAGIKYALTGPVAASILAPFVTAVPVVDIWTAATEDLDRVCAAVDAEQVPNGHNVVFRQETGDYPLRFRERADDRWLVNRFRLYVDLRANPQRGREQAAHLRQEVIGF